MSTGDAFPTSNPFVLWDNCGPDTGRADGCANTNIGPGRSNKESDVAPILPHPSADVTRACRTDGCPECVTNLETPSSTYATPDGFIANYVCLSCGHAWTTAWRD